MTVLFNFRWQNRQWRCWLFSCSDNTSIFLILSSLVPCLQSLLYLLCKSNLLGRKLLRGLSLLPRCSRNLQLCSHWSLQDFLFNRCVQRFGYFLLDLLSRFNYWSFFFAYLGNCCGSRRWFSGIFSCRLCACSVCLCGACFISSRSSCVCTC